MVCGSRPAPAMAPQPTFLVGQRSVTGSLCLERAQRWPRPTALSIVGLAVLFPVHSSFTFIINTQVRASAREVSQGLIPRWQPSRLPHGSQVGDKRISEHVR